jgi:hypothetical protein
MRYFGNYVRLLALPLYIGLAIYACSGTASTRPNSPVNLSRSKWINSINSKYDSQRYIVVTGSGKNDEEAKRNALANLVGYFGQSVQVEQVLSTTYFGAVKNGVTGNWTESTVLEENINVSAANTLIGVEFPEPLYDGNDWYAAALMDKAKTEKIYADMIRANQAMITNLININQPEKNTIEGFSRYYFAAVTADINMSFWNVLSLISASVPSGLKNGDEFRFEAANIAKMIPVRVAVEKRADIDRAESIRNAFSRALSEIGFRITSENAPYTLEVNLSLKEVIFPNRQTEFVLDEIPAEFAHYDISANFTDTATKTGLLPIYSVDGQAGQSTLQEAENRAIAAAERKINEQYRDWLSEHLAQRLPGR